MEQALLEQIQRLPESVQQEALHYIEGLVAKHNQSVQTPPLDRKNAFGIWKGEVWMSDDFNAPLDDLQRIYVMGRFLLDINVFLWLIQGDPQLSDYLR
jgi:Protein of unknown function (DUF2281)